MIFVTVGTHEQSFERLLKWIDKMIEEKIINEEFFCQKGYTDYETKNYNSQTLIPFDKMQEYISKSRIVITHGGPASFLSVLSLGKVPIVVPRKKEFGEHVNNHQLDFVNEVKKRLNNILVADTYEELVDCILNYDDKIKKINSKNISNNKEFNDKLIEEIKRIL